MKTRSNQSPFQDVACPTCKSPPNCWCTRQRRGASWTERCQYHAARKRAYEQMVNDMILAQTYGPASDANRD